MGFQTGIVKLRDFPYPFKCGLAICSDIDDCSIENFIKIHKVINSKKHGLGLPVADSFFGVAESKNQLAYFNSDSSKRWREAEFIKQAIHDGLIDSLHSWGDFNTAPPAPELLQTVARELTTEFVKYGLEIPIWINHGSPNNQQNLFSRLFPTYNGDNPDSSLYTMPFIKQLGIKYYWASELVDWPLSTANLKAWKKNKQILTNKIKNFVKILMRKSHHRRTTEQIVSLTNKMILRDSTALIAFNRFARHPNEQYRWMADRNSLKYSLSNEILEQLIQDEGYLIIYTHLAKPVITQKENFIFEKEVEDSMELLSNYYVKKDIWVTTTSSLLKYKNNHDNIKWDVTDSDDDIIINIRGVTDPIDGIYQPSENDLSGISFYSQAVNRTKIKVLGKELDAKIFSRNFHDNAGWIGFDIADELNTQLID